MYASLSILTDAGPEPIASVRASVLQLLAGRDTVEILPGTWILATDSTDEFEVLAEDLEILAEDFPGQLQYAVSLHNRNQPLRSNGAFDDPSVIRIIER